MDSLNLVFTLLYHFQSIVIILYQTLLIFLLKKKKRMLDREESVNELARILGGVEITDSVRESAAEMKQMAEQVKSGLMA